MNVMVVCLLVSSLASEASQEELWSDYLASCDAALLEEASYSFAYRHAGTGEGAQRIEIDAHKGEQVIRQYPWSREGENASKPDIVANFRESVAEVIELQNDGAVDFYKDAEGVPTGRLAVPRPFVLRGELGYHNARAWAKGHIVRSFDAENLVIVHGPKNVAGIEYKVHFERMKDGSLRKAKEEEYLDGVKRTELTFSDFSLAGDGTTLFPKDITFRVFDRADAETPSLEKHIQMTSLTFHEDGYELPFHEIPPGRFVTDYRSAPPLEYTSGGLRENEVFPEGTNELVGRTEDHQDPHVTGIGDEPGNAQKSGDGSEAPTPKNEGRSFLLFLIGGLFALFALGIVAHFHKRREVA